MYRYIYISAKHASSLGGMLPRPIQQPWLAPACKTPWSFFGLPESRIARRLSTELWCATKRFSYGWTIGVMLMVGRNPASFPTWDGAKWDFNYQPQPQLVQDFLPSTVWLVHIHLHLIHASDNVGKQAMYWLEFGLPTVFFAWQIIEKKETKTIHVGGTPIQISPTFIWSLIARLVN